MTAEQIIKFLKEEYLSCPNVYKFTNQVYCSTWYRHDDCERLMNILFEITQDSIYTRPEIRQEVKDAIVDMLTDPDTSEILRRLKD